MCICIHPLKVSEEVKGPAIVGNSSIGNRWHTQSSSDMSMRNAKFRRMVERVVDLGEMDEEEAENAVRMRRCNTWCTHFS